MVSSICFGPFPFTFDSGRSTWTNGKSFESCVFEILPEVNGVTVFLSRCERRGPGVTTGESSMQKKTRTNERVETANRDVTCLSNLESMFILTNHAI